MIKYISNLIFTVSVLGLTCAHASDSQSQGASSTPTIVLEERYKEIQEERKALKKVIRDLSQIIVVIKSAEENIKKKQIDKNDIEKTINLLKSAITKLNSLPPETQLERDNPVWLAYISSFQELRSISTIDPESELSELETYLPSDYFRDQVRADTEVDRLLTRIVARIPKSDGVESDNNETALSILYGKIRYRDKITKLDIEEQIVNAQNYLSAFSETNVKMIFDASKAQLLQKLSSLALELQKEVETREALNKKLLEELGEINQELEAKRTKQTIIDQGLIFAVYGMIGVLLLMFLSLRLFHSDVALELVKRRALIEVVGMAFMLITIIILGTGGKINTETLGTLLGTIAGYIFGRIGADRDVRDTASVSNQPNTYEASRSQ
ncbi:hypothetical protein MN202_03380 [Rheinheimera muenzenbergensis]|uniref:Mechanosensitive ion channel n=1 Tax=Rheinheimera muenzenbergensis TaxID=1193628 RepID=A0ABU8C408_9GAMM